MATLRPSEQHRTEDWSALSDRLNIALPVQPRERRRVLVLPLLLITAFLSSNAAWWHEQQYTEREATQLKVQVAELQSTIAVLTEKQPVIHTDTVYRIVYKWEKMPPSVSGLLNNGSNVTKNTSVKYPESAASPATVNMAQSTDQVSNISGFTNAKNGDEKTENANNYAWHEVLPMLPEYKMEPLKVYSPIISVHKIRINNVTPEKEPTHTATQNLTAALRPKYFKAGANIGWLHAVSPGLMHEGGFGGGIGGAVGFSRHWSLTAGCNMGKLHYKAHVPEAVLGAPQLPMLPSADHHFEELDVTGQRLMQLDIGLRYTFLQPGRPRPFFGLGYSSQIVMPFSVVYEIQHEPSGMIEKGTYDVVEAIHLPGSMRLSTGFEIPVSKRFDLLLEANYLRQWKKSNSQVPDLLGIRGGIYWLF